MNHRALLSILALTAALGGQVKAEEPVERILGELRRMGYETVSVERTLLRRTRIVARNDEAQREIIVNPNTGEILRDLWIPIESASSGTSGGILDDGSGSGSDDDDDDDDDDGGDGDDGDSGHDDGGDDGGDDNSGHGGGGDGNSGQGGGG